MTSDEVRNRLVDALLERNRLEKFMDRLRAYCPLCDGPCGHLAQAEHDHDQVDSEAQEHSGPGGCVNSLSPGTSPTNEEWTDA